VDEFNDLCDLMSVFVFDLSSDKISRIYSLIRLYAVELFPITVG